MDEKLKMKCINNGDARYNGIDESLTIGKIYTGIIVNQGEMFLVDADDFGVSCKYWLYRFESA